MEILDDPHQLGQALGEQHKWDVLGMGEDKEKGLEQQQVWLPEATQQGPLVAPHLALHPTGQGVSLHIPQSAINATVEQDILLSVEYSCHGVPTIEWKYTSNWGVQKIVEWKPGTQANISQSHKDRVCTFDNGSIQLFSVGIRDSGYYVITVTEHLGSSQFGTIVLHVSEILYEDLHFVAVFLAFLAAVASVLISLMWVCNKCAYKFQRKRRHKLKESTTEEIELQNVEC
ncbi:PREDICTED: V-set and transmembrane domain-containing protein 5 [Miniopterus natalensis]|uniref:V-set and transmembrane domain-containing protein 5 n=1 Tax=Miniopterus natalensis TaxID=291302 RepID=UPI0007A6C174|nr:PREDICTED: V-set and transmembrane domain-containing protein 5 [Miniopterus natalensis]